MTNPTLFREYSQACALLFSSKALQHGLDIDYHTASKILLHASEKVVVRLRLQDDNDAMFVAIPGLSFTGAYHVLEVRRGAGSFVGDVNLKYVYSNFVPHAFLDDPRMKAQTAGCPALYTQAAVDFASTNWAEHLKWRRSSDVLTVSIIHTTLRQDLAVMLANPVSFSYSSYDPVNVQLNAAIAAASENWPRVTILSHPMSRAEALCCGTQRVHVYYCGNCGSQFSATATCLRCDNVFNYNGMKPFDIDSLYRHPYKIVDPGHLSVMPRALAEYTGGEHPLAFTDKYNESRRDEFTNWLLSQVRHQVAVPEVKQRHITI